MNPEEHAKRLLNVIGRLTGLLKEENKQLDVPGRSKGLTELVKEKDLLSRSYEQEMKILINREQRAKLKPEVMTHLVEAATALGALMDENRRKLEMKMEATKTIFKIMAEAAKEFRAASGGYGRTGAYGSDSQKPRAAYQPPVSLGVNREL
jgi:nitric oxide reductase activation protein